eukprot:COSAG04_NODE_5942_length_1450_cov_1.128053_2_plen_117_part_00
MATATKADSSIADNAECQSCGQYCVVQARGLTKGLDAFTKHGAESVHELVPQLKPMLLHELRGMTTVGGAPNLTEESGWDADLTSLAAALLAHLNQIRQAVPVLVSLATAATASHH